MRNIRNECGDGPHTYPSLAPIGEGGDRLRDSPSPLLDLYQKYAETCGDGERYPDLMDTGTHPEEASGQTWTGFRNMGLLLVLSRKSRVKRF